MNASLTQAGQRGRLTMHYYFNNSDTEDRSTVFGPADGFSNSLTQELCILFRKVPVLLLLAIRALFWFPVFHSKSVPSVMAGLKAQFVDSQPRAGWHITC